MAYKDKAKQAEYMRKYHVKNRERLNAVSRQYGKDHPRDRREYFRQQYLANREARIAQAKVCTRVRADRNIAWVVEYLVQHPCSKCGAVEHLDFHHPGLREDKDQVGRLVHRGASLERIQEEIDRCVVLCRSCHRKHHNRERRRHGEDSFRETCAQG